MLFRIFFSLFVCIVLPAAKAFASCGASSCPVDPVGARPLESGWVRLGYEFEFVPQDAVQVNGRRSAVGQVRGHHDEVYTLTRVHRLKASLDLSDRWGVDISLPYVFRSHQHVHNHRGQKLIDTWNLSGVGDWALLGRWKFFQPENQSRPALSLLLGMKFPTGRERLVNAGGAEAESPIQPGTGSYDATVGASSLQTVLGSELFFSAAYRFNGRGKERYRIGDVFSANAGAVYPLLSWLGLEGQVNLRLNREDDKGDTREETAKTGGDYLFLSPGLQIKLSEAWRASALAQLPVYQWVNGIQLISDYSLLAGISYRFRGWGG